MSSNIETRIFANREKVKQLRDEHRDLDLAIAQMSGSAQADQFMLKRMKKRKLRLKDMIERLESERIPDLNA
ncbi:YdcH family protein [Candidatus Foliamicus sp.]